MTSGDPPVPDDEPPGSFCQVPNGPAAVDSACRLGPANGGVPRPSVDYRIADIVYGIRCEQAYTLSDLLIRRTHIAFETRDAGVGVAARVAEVGRAVTEVGTPRQAAEVDDYARDAQRVFGVEGSPTPDGSSEAPGSSDAASARAASALVTSPERPPEQCAPDRR